MRKAADPIDHTVFFFVLCISPLYLLTLTMRSDQHFRGDGKIASEFQRGGFAFHSVSIG